MIVLLLTILPYSASAAEVLVEQPTTTNVMLLIGFVSMAIGLSFICSMAESVLLSMTPSYIADVQDSNPKSENAQALETR